MRAVPVGPHAIDQRPERDKRSGRFALAALYFAAMVVLADMYLTQPILPLLAAEFGVSPAASGLSVSVVVLAIALTSTVSGPLSDAAGRKPVMVASCALLAIPTLLCALAPSFGALLAFRALQGIFIPGLTAVAVAYIADLVGPEALGGAVGGWIAATVAGGLTGRVASGVITALWGWRAAFVAFAALTAICAALLALALPRAQARGSAGWRRAYLGMLAHLRDRRLVGAFVIGGALFFGFIGVFTYLPYYLTAPPFSLPPGLVAFAYVSYLAGVVVSPIAGQLSARVSRRAIMGVGLVIAAAAIAVSGVPSLPIIVLSLFVLCAGMFTAQSTAPAFVNATAQRDRGGAGALYLMAYYLGGTLGGVLPGLAWQAFAWPGVMAICIAALLTAFASAWFLCRE